MKRGDIVRAWFDTGAMGSAIIYGHVVAAGPRAFVVEWESSIRNRRPQSCHLVKKVRSHEEEAEARAALQRCGRLEKS